MTNLLQTEPENQPKSCETPGPVAPPNAWHEHAEELARWALERFAARTDVWGGYAPDGVTTRPPKEDRGRLWLDEDGILVRHFRANGRDDVVGLHPISTKNTGRWGAVDIDWHGEGSTKPWVNKTAALHWYRCLVRRGFRPLLTESNGLGGYHLRVLLSADVSAERLHYLFRGLVADHQPWGFKEPPETFPKQKAVPPGGFGNWLRLPGLHPKHGTWSRVWDGKNWLEGEAAVRYLLTYSGDDPGLVPEDGLRDYRVRAYMAKFPHKAEGQGRDDVAYNLLAGLARDHKLTDGEALAYAEEWDFGNDPPKGYDRLKQILGNVHLYGQRDYGAADGEDGYEDENGHEEARGVPATSADLPPPDPDRPPRPDPAVYFGLAGEFVRRVEPQTEADPVAILAQLLAMYGNKVGRDPYYKVGKTRHHANLFVNLVGDTAVGRKGTSLDFAEDLFRLVDEAWARERLLHASLSSGEGLVEAVCDSVYKTCRKKNAATGAEEEYQVLEKEGVADKRLLVAGAEFAGALTVMRREGNTLSAALRCAWDGKDLRIVTKNNKTKATDPHISIIGHITRPELRQRLADTEVSNGLANRFLWVYSTRSKLLPDGGWDVDVSDIAARIAEAARRVEEQTATDLFQAEGMVRTEAAAELWREAYCGELSRELPGPIGNILTRASAQVLRLSMIYALLDGSVIIAREHLEAALALWRYCEASARWAFGDATGDRTADKLLTALCRAGAAGLSRGSIYRELFRGNVEEEEIERALGLLHAAGLALKLPPREGGRGRKAEVWVATSSVRQAA